MADEKQPEGRAGDGLLKRAIKAVLGGGGLVGAIATESAAANGMADTGRHLMVDALGKTGIKAMGSAVGALNGTVGPEAKKLTGEYYDHLANRDFAAAAVDAVALQKLNTQTTNAFADKVVAAVDTIVKGFPDGAMHRWDVEGASGHGLNGTPKPKTEDKANTK